MRSPARTCTAPARRPSGPRTTPRPSGSPRASPARSRPRRGPRSARMPLPDAPAVVCDGSGRIVRSNSAFHRTAGAAGDADLFGMRLSQILTGPDRDARLLRADGITVGVEVIRFGPLIDALSVVALVERDEPGSTEGRVDRTWAAELERLARVGTWSLDLASGVVARSDTLEELYRVAGVDPAADVERRQADTLYTALRDGRREPRRPRRAAPAGRGPAQLPGRGRAGRRRHPGARRRRRPRRHRHPPRRAALRRPHGPHARRRGGARRGRSDRRGQPRAVRAAELLPRAAARHVRAHAGRRAADRRAAQLAAAGAARRPVRLPRRGCAAAARRRHDGVVRAGRGRHPDRGRRDPVARGRHRRLRAPPRRRAPAPRRAGATSSPACPTAPPASTWSTGCWPGRAATGSRSSAEVSTTSSGSTPPSATRRATTCSSRWPDGCSATCPSAATRRGCRATSSSSSAPTTPRWAGPTSSPGWSPTSCAPRSPSTAGRST